MFEDDKEFIQQQLTLVETQITELNKALIQVASGQTYSLDTGQSRVSVTQANIGELHRVIAALWSERRMLRSELGCGFGSVYVRPGY